MTKTDDNGLPYFDSEQEFQDYLERKFEQQGHTAIQEVSAKHSDYRIDLLLLHEDYGQIGFEIKYLTGGSAAARAHQQIIEQYATQKYSKWRVNKWVFAPYMPKRQHEIDHRSESFQQGKLEVLEHFFQRYGIGVLNVHERPYARIKWSNSRDYMIPAFPMKREMPDRQHVTDIENIEDRSKDRLFSRANKR